MMPNISAMLAFIMSYHLDTSRLRGYSAELSVPANISTYPNRQNAETIINTLTVPPPPKREPPPVHALFSQ
jgi:hypothetical protein